MQTATQINEISIQFRDYAPKGFILDAANGGLIQAYLVAKGLDVTIESISTAIEALKFSLEWEPGFAPTAPVAPVVRDARTQKQKAHDGGVKPFEPSQYSDTSESSWAKEIREGREAHAQQNKKRERDELRHKETHQTVMTANGRISYAQSEALNAAARRRHAQDDAREFGNPAAVSQPQRIPLHATPQDLKNYDREQIREWMQRRKIAGLPIN